MDTMLAVIRPKTNIAKTDYRPRHYDILLLDTKTPLGDKIKVAKYLPTFSMKPGEEDLREAVLTHLYKLTGGDVVPGLKGDRAILIKRNRPEDMRASWQASQYDLYCVCVSQIEKLNKRFVAQAQNGPGFYSLEAVFEMLNSSSIIFPPATKYLVQTVDSWLREKHSRPRAAEALFRVRAEYRMRFTVNNPVFLPNRLTVHGGGETLGNLPEEIQLTANEALAKMLSIEKCDNVVINQMFGQAYKTKVNHAVKNVFWPRKPDYSKIVNPFPPPAPTELLWTEKYPMHSSAAQGDVDGVNNLIRQGELHSKKDSISWAPIHYAAWFGFPEVVDALLAAGCSPNIINNENETPLHLAAQKGNDPVASILRLHQETNLVQNNSGKTAQDIYQTWTHATVADYIEQVNNRPSATIAVNTMDEKTFYLKLTSGDETCVRQLNDQMLQEFGMPHDPYSQIFTIWICSTSLELQLKPDHCPVKQMNLWTTRTLDMWTTSYRTEEPVLKWRRNAKISIEKEKQVLHQKAIDLLFSEAYSNYIHALYPCKDPDAVIFAAIWFYLCHGKLDASSAKSFINRELPDLVPQPILKQREASQWANKILREYREILQGNDRSSQTLKRKFLSHCHYLTLYGSAFFTGTLLSSPQGSRPRHADASGFQALCHIGINDVGIHFISMETKTMLLSYKYSEITWEREENTIVIEVKWPEDQPSQNVPIQVVRLSTPQAELINNLMRKLTPRQDE